MESKTTIFLGALLLLSSSSTLASPQLVYNFYSNSCPNLQYIVHQTMYEALNANPRNAAFILRLFFHDCFVLGCDGSDLLDDTATFTGEKNALPNQNSLGGFDVIDTIKSRVEDACNETVSCADILALAAREAVYLSGGPWWNVLLGRRDSLNASQAAANAQLPPPFANLSSLISAFAAKGLTARDMTALSGGHTIGYSRCVNFRSRVYNDTNINPTFAANRRSNCPLNSSGDDNLAPLETPTPYNFDNRYFSELVAMKGLLHSDQELYNGGSQDSLVLLYSSNYSAFASDFVTAMVKMGNINPLTGASGQIRRNCRFRN